MAKRSVPPPDPLPEPVTAPACILDAMAEALRDMVWAEDPVSRRIARRDAQEALETCNRLNQRQ
ncbi:MAG: hypothetical protein ACU0BO_18485 [Limimaricola soesokkakensis]|uniref:hypothetical protein n=1 Tax=Limimaricola soesokkakensis TaxID=1343159 RepID=UPI00405962B7